MKYTIEVSPIASENIVNAFEYYVSKVNKKVASDFLKDYKKTYRALQINPFYQFHDNNYRFLPFEKFHIFLFLLLKNPIKQYL